MAEEDRIRWDRRYDELGPLVVGDAVGLPDRFVPFAELFPTSGLAVELACGRGDAAVWLARRGLDYVGFDVSPVAVDVARRLADAAGVGERCRFEVADLDDGLPPTPAADVVMCHLFRDPKLDRAMVDRLKPGGLLAVAVLSQIGSHPGRFRAAPGELTRAFAAGLDVAGSGEGGGEAWLVGFKR